MATKTSSQIPLTITNMIILKSKLYINEFILAKFDSFLVFEIL